MAKTSIEWCDHSVNPFRARNKETGATGHWCCKISAGCKGCYASRLQPRFGTLPFVAENREKVELYLEERVLHEVLRRRKPTRYFWCDMTDMFLEDYPDEWIDQCFAAMALTPWHTHMILTKRAERLLRYSDFRFDNREHAIGSWMRYYKPVDPGLPEMPLPNVWLGVSCEDQQHADERIPLLLQTPAAVRFVSAEPLLGPLDLYKYMPWTDISTPEFNTGIDWVIVGGESGPCARPMHPDWVRSLRDQAQAASVPFFFKQWGEWTPGVNVDRVTGTVQTADWFGDRWHFSTENLARHDGHIDDEPDLYRIGKRAAGRRLDGRTWDEFPEVRNA